MKRTFIAALVAAAFLAPVSPVAADPVASTPVGPGGSVLIDVRTPDYAYTVKLEVVGWDKNQVAVDQTTDSDTRDVRPRIVREGSTTRITPGGGPQRKRVFFGLLSSGSGATVSWTVHVPSSAKVSALADNSALRIDGVHGALTARTSNGPIDIRGAGPRLDAETANGHVDAGIATLDGGAPNVRIRTSNGGVMLLVPKDFHTRVTAQTLNGGIENPLAGASGPGSASIVTSNGGITVSTGS